MWGEECGWVFEVVRHSVSTEPGAAQSGELVQRLPQQCPFSCHSSRKYQATPPRNLLCCAALRFARTCVEATWRRFWPASSVLISSRGEVTSTSVAPGTVTVPLMSFLISRRGCFICRGPGKEEVVSGRASEWVVG